MTSGIPWLRHAADLVLPVRCLGCGHRAVAWCPECRSAALDLRVRPLDGLLVAAASVYADDVRAAILGYKEHGRRDLSTPLSDLLRSAVRSAVSGLDRPLLVPMPSTARATRARGGDHMRRLIARAAPRAEVAVVLGSRSAPDAVGMSVAGRHNARRQAMYARQGIEKLVGGRDLLLVDDVVTTGSTLLRAAEIVRACGAREVRAAVIAETERQVSGR